MSIFLPNSYASLNEFIVSSYRVYLNMAKTIIAPFPGLPPLPLPSPQAIWVKSQSTLQAPMINPKPSCARDPTWSFQIKIKKRLEYKVRLQSRIKIQ